MRKKAHDILVGTCGFFSGCFGFEIIDKGLSSTPQSTQTFQKLLSFIPDSTSLPDSVTSVNSIQTPSSGFDWKKIGITALGVLVVFYLGFQRRHANNKKSPPESRRPTSKGPKSTKYYGFQNRYANHCFANALLVCLVYLPGFKEKICQAEAARNNSSNLILKSLAALFKRIDQDRKNLAVATVEAKKENLCNEITRGSPEIQVFYKKGGDSRSLFQILCQNIPSDIGVFSFQQDKTVTCEGCSIQGKQVTPRIFVENPFMLDIREDFYFKNNYYFTPQTELRTCKACGPSTPHRKEIVLSNFPEVLAIRIGDTPNFRREKVDPWLDISLDKSGGGKQGYKFVGGVYNTMKGYDGCHSVAYICQKGRDGDRMLLCYNDMNVKRVSLKEIRGYPKLMFYVKNSEESVVLDMEERYDDFDWSLYDNV